LVSVIGVISFVAIPLRGTCRQLGAAPAPFSEAADGPQITEITIT
jgi:hypothetical protein